MAKFFSSFSMSGKTLARFVEKQGRRALVQHLAEAAGGKLEAYLRTFPARACDAATRAPEAKEEGSMQRARKPGSWPL